MNRLPLRLVTGHDYLQCTSEMASSTDFARVFLDVPDWEQKIAKYLLLEKKKLIDDGAIVDQEIVFWHSEVLAYLSTSGGSVVLADLISHDGFEVFSEQFKLSDSAVSAAWIITVAILHKCVFDKDSKTATYRLYRI